MQLFNYWSSSWKLQNHSNKLWQLSFNSFSQLAFIKEPNALGAQLLVPLFSVWLLCNIKSESESELEWRIFIFIFISNINNNATKPAKCRDIVRASRIWLSLRISRDNVVETHSSGCTASAAQPATPSRSTVLLLFVFLSSYSLVCLLLCLAA